MNNCSQSMNNGRIGVRGGVIPSVYTVKSIMTPYYITIFLEICVLN